MTTRSASDKNRKIKLWVILGLCFVGAIVASIGVLPAIINLLLEPWRWFFDFIIFKGLKDNFGMIPIIGPIVRNTYQLAYSSAFLLVQIAQTIEMLLDVFTVKISPARAKFLKSARMAAYGVELLVNVWFGVANPWGTQSTWIVWRVIVTLFYILVQTFSFEYILKYILELTGALGGELLDSTKKSVGKASEPIDVNAKTVF